MTDSPDAENQATTEILRAQQRIIQALSELDEMQAADRSALPRAIETALTSAKDALAAVATECRRDTPYSELVLVGDSTGLYYTCSHPQPHTYPAGP
jgi:hypothetical protein